jgi:regulator of sirC expression with transglutaminase-like and TPR domain
LSDQAIALNPKDAMAFGNRGFAYTNLGDHQKAIND